MRNTVVTFLLGALLISSCSTDKTSDNPDNSILGTWDLTALTIDEATASDEEEFGQDILNMLTASNCYLVSLSFNEDLRLVTEDASNYLEIGVNPGGTGLDVPCPSQRDTETTTYAYADGVLTFIDDTQETISVALTISGSTMTMAAQELDVQNFNAGGELIFTKR
ncbi:lipocalin family protein [uncultured Muriicola sp.]|uniref:lipocalin family protein n=1 Tax=uncultured Muriicola sp. TaxID=1583102 RepID=UPI0026048307|nr:lipocalin family protein [uncultured Muriicola sp.]